MANLRLAAESEIPVSDYDQPALFEWQQFYDFRNHVIRVLRVFGSAGPCGEVDLSASDGEDLVFEEGVAKNPDFFVVDDMWNEHDRLSIVECDPKHVKTELIESIGQMACEFPGWRVVLRMGDCGLDVFGDKVIPGGRRFWDCGAVAELASRCSAPIDYGPVVPFQQEMYPLWLAVVSGQFTSSAAFPPPPDRQWRQAVEALDEMSQRKQPGSPLSPFAYGRIRCDLHPHTRLQLVQQFLRHVSSYPCTVVEQARRNVQKDAGAALAASPSTSERESPTRLISTAQHNVAAWSKPNDVVFWWPGVLSEIGEADDTLGGNPGL
jgi:hypothetical protein